MCTKTILQVENLDLFYGKYQAVSNASFDIREGEIFGLLGPNGAGKTSTLSAIQGLVKPASGNITIAGYDVQKQALQARACTGVQLQSTSFQAELPVLEIIRLYACLYGASLNTRQVRQLLREYGLEETANQKTGKLSGGQQQRVSLIIAMIHKPDLVILDEPTTGLDPQSRRQLWRHLEQMRDKGHAVLLTTHSMEEAEAVCNRVAILDKGKIIQTDTPRNLINQYRQDDNIMNLVRGERVTLEDVFIGLTSHTNHC